MLGPLAPARPRGVESGSACAPTCRRSTLTDAIERHSHRFRPVAGLGPRPDPTASSARNGRARRRRGEGNTNWAVFRARQFPATSKIERLIVVPHYRMVGSGVFWARSRPLARVRQHCVQR